MIVQFLWRNHVIKSPWRILYLFAFIFLFGLLFYFIWTPGTIVANGAHDLGQNGIWIQHGWLASDNWLKKNNREKEAFRNIEKIKKLSQVFSLHGIRYVFPHLCPANRDGSIQEIDNVQASIFLDEFADFKVLPWVGGVLYYHCLLESKDWRNNFVGSIKNLLKKHDRFSGIHLNIEPMPSGNEEFILLLKELKTNIPEGKILSVSAFPPPSFLHQFSDVHWELEYYKEISLNVHQMVIMMYDTSIRLKKVYQYVVNCWVRSILSNIDNSKVLLGVPAYSDFGVQYHYPEVENLENSIMGIHGALKTYSNLPGCYEGISIYSEWEMDESEWKYLEDNFLK